MNDDNDDMVSADDQPAPTLDLRAVLAALMDEKKRQDEAQLDAKIAELQKLVADAETAQADYDAAYAGLADQENLLKREIGILQASLEAALTPAGVEAVKSIVAATVDGVEAVRLEVEAAKAAMEQSAAAAALTAQQRKDAEALLAVWRKPVKNIGGRQKLVADAIKHIQSLDDTARRGEAYWKLYLANSDQTPGQASAKSVFDGPTELIEPDKLRDRLNVAWAAFSAATSADVAAALDLAAKQADLAKKTKTFNDSSKNLIKAITDALAQREASANAA